MSDPSAIEAEGDLWLAAHSQVPVLVAAGRPAERAKVARLIHDNGACPDGPFVMISCDSEGEIDLEHEFNEARGGTLFIDEIGVMPPRMQLQLFLLLGDAELQRRDEQAPRGRTRTRVIAGTSHSLIGDVPLLTVSARLFYRLNVIHVDARVRDRAE